MGIIEGERSAAGNKSWVLDIQNKIKDVNSDAESKLWNKPTIYRVPAHIKDLNPHAYSPQVVSFGPYHHGDGHLKPMEEHKHRSLLHFLNRAKKPFEDFVNSMEEEVQQLMDSYEGLDEEWRDMDRFLELMIVDGCFMLEILRAAEFSSGYADYAGNDPIFSSHGLLYNLGYIKRDMLMMENQLPLMVLKKLVAVESGESKKDDDINWLVVEFCSPNDNVFLQRDDYINLADLGLHPLDVCRKSMLQPPEDESESSETNSSRFWSATPSSANGSAHVTPCRANCSEDPDSEDSTGSRTTNLLGGGGSCFFQICWPTSKSTENSSEIIRSAIELHEAGIHFKRSKTRSLNDIQFEHGVLSLPVIVVEDMTESMLLNLMAFEHLHLHVSTGNEMNDYAGNEMNDYAFLMDSIIDSREDVRMLHSNRIIQNMLESDEAAAKVFNSLGKDVQLDPKSALNKVHTRVNKYCGKRWNKWRANLIQTYFTSPWAVISLVAAVVLLSLAIIQTVFTILAFYAD